MPDDFNKRPVLKEHDRIHPGIAGAVNPMEDGFFNVVSRYSLAIKDKVLLSAARFELIYRKSRL